MDSIKYVAGAIVLAYSLKKVGTKYPVMCMVTGDVPSKAKKVCLSLIIIVIELNNFRY